MYQKDVIPPLCHDIAGNYYGCDSTVWPVLAWPLKSAPADAPAGRGAIRDNLWVIQGVNAAAVIAFCSIRRFLRAER